MYTHTHPLRGGGSSGGNGGEWLPREMKGCLSQKRNEQALERLSAWTQPLSVTAHRWRPWACSLVFGQWEGGCLAGQGKQVGRELCGLTLHLPERAYSSVSRAPQRGVKRPLAAGRCLPGGTVRWRSSWLWAVDNSLPWHLCPLFTDNSLPSLPCF